MTKVPASSVKVDDIIMIGTWHLCVMSATLTGIGNCMIHIDAVVLMTDMPHVAVGTKMGFTVASWFQIDRVC